MIGVLDVIFWAVGFLIIGKTRPGLRLSINADGDIVNCDTKARTELAGAISVWGQELPKKPRKDGTAVFSDRCVVRCVC